MEKLLPYEKEPRHILLTPTASVPPIAELVSSESRVHLVDRISSDAHLPDQLALKELFHSRDRRFQNISLEDRQVSILDIYKRYQQYSSVALGVSEIIAGMENISPQ